MALGKWADEHDGKKTSEGTMKGGLFETLANKIVKELKGPELAKFMDASPGFQASIVKSYAKDADDSHIQTLIKMVKRLGAGTVARQGREASSKGMQKP